MDRIEIGKLSAAYDVRRLGLADAPVVYAFCKADTQYYARCGAEVTLARAPQPDRLGGAGRPAGAGLPAVHTGDGQG